jgi:hypothetical protein
VQARSSESLDALETLGTEGGYNGTTRAQELLFSSSQFKIENRKLREKKFFPKPRIQLVEFK